LTPENFSSSSGGYFEASFVRFSLETFKFF
jgi:hypothetical protein